MARHPRTSHVADLATLPARLREARLARKLLQRELAAAVGLTQSRIAEYERGDREPSLAIAAALADALGIVLFPSAKK